MSHPCDVVFHYFDPYLNKRIYLHTDLKSYSRSTLQHKKIRQALESLAMTVECAAVSPEWRQRYLLDETEPHEVRGLLFVVNHDRKAPEDFDRRLNQIAGSKLPIGRAQILHVLGPNAVSAMFSVATDMKLALQDKQLSPRYRFFYPDLTLWKRHTAADERAAATVETLMSPYFIVRHDAIRNEQSNAVELRAGFLVYYGRDGSTVEEFVYLLDSLLRFQLITASEQIRVRVFHRTPSDMLKSNFEKAKIRYCKDWGFDGSRETELMAVTIDTLSQIEACYVPDNIGWSDR